MKTLNIQNIIVSIDFSKMLVEGIVRETLPYAQYRVEIDGPRQITAHAPSGPGKNFIRVLIGDRVRLELSPRDVTRGRIVQKL